MRQVKKRRCGLSVQRIFIVRHGETAYNRARRFQGFLPIPLNETGRDQAQRLGSYLQQTQIDCVYTSDLTRCTETAELVCGDRSIDIIHDERLREHNLGQFQGLTRDQIADLYPLEFMRWRSNDAYVVPGGESRVMLRKRVITAWQDIISTCSGEQIMLVSHGGSIRQLLTAVFGDEVLASTRITNTSLTIIARTDDSWAMEKLATTPHL